MFSKITDETEEKHICRSFLAFHYEHKPFKSKNDISLSHTSQLSYFCFFLSEIRNLPLYDVCGKRQCLVTQDESKQTVSYAVNYCGKGVFCGICP